MVLLMFPNYKTYKKTIRSLRFIKTIYLKPAYHEYVKNIKRAPMTRDFLSRHPYDTGLDQLFFF